MQISKKLFPIILASTLVTSSFVMCSEVKEADECSECNALNHEKHLITGAYALLGAYSAKKTLESVAAGVALLVLQGFVSADPNLPVSKKIGANAVFCVAHLINAVKFSVFGYLTYFSAKNVIKRLKEKDAGKDKSKEEEVEEEVEECSESCSCSCGCNAEPVPEPAA